jgi:hypothetical protein
MLGAADELEKERVDEEDEEERPSPPPSRDSRARRSKLRRAADSSSLIDTELLSRIPPSLAIRSRNGRARLLISLDSKRPFPLASMRRKKSKLLG